jgi:hypothetical protein
MSLLIPLSPTPLIQFLHRAQHLSPLSLFDPPPRYIGERTDLTRPHAVGAILLPDPISNPQDLQILLTQLPPVAADRPLADHVDALVAGVTPFAEQVAARIAQMPEGWLTTLFK